MNKSKEVTIFEGPDGGGKSTAAKQYAQDTGAKYVHFNQLSRVSDGLSRMYVEAMLPAIMGYQPVVLDRCWLSETPYGEVFREGRDRLTNAGRRMLERLALRCGAVVVRCQPDFEIVLASFNSRKGSEMLHNDVQLYRVYDLYTSMGTDLPTVKYDFNNEDYSHLVERIEMMRYTTHPTEIVSAGNWNANVILVGEGFAERKNQDPWYQWPFASFSGEGCSKWLTDELNKAGIDERQLLWVNCGEPLDMLEITQHTKVVALGEVAYRELYNHKIRSVRVDHPQFHKRFKSGQAYPLIQHIYDATPE